jgi:protein-disulfide isomerase
MMANGGAYAATGVLAALVGGAAVYLWQGNAAPVGTADKASIEKIVREYVLTHPELLPEAMANLQANQTTKTVLDNRKTIETPYGKAWAGAEDGDVTLVEFFDYSCGYCRAAVADVERLLSEDKRLKVVYRELPVLGEASVAAARISLAVAKTGNYSAFHKALYGGGQVSDATIDAALIKAGLDAKAVRASINPTDVDAELGKTTQLQHDLNLTGTPSWVVGDQVIIGAVGYDDLKKAIAKARAGKT